MKLSLLSPATKSLGSYSPSYQSNKAYSDCSCWFASANKEYLTLSSNPTLNISNDFELGLWIKFDSLATQAIVTKGNEYALYYDSSSSTFTFSIGSTVLSNSWITPATSTWYFLRATYGYDADLDGVAMTLSVNNQKVSSACNTVASGSSDFLVGKDASGNYLNGYIDSMYLSSVFTGEQASFLYNSGSGRVYKEITDTTLVKSWWDMSSETGLQFDSKGSNHLIAAADPMIAPAVYGSELLSNGSFEADLTGWTQVVGDGSVAYTSVSGEYYSGSGAVKLTAGATPASNPNVYQSFTVTAGKTYVIAVRTRGDGTNAGRYSVYDATNSASIIATTTTAISSTSYTLLTTSFVAPADCATVQVVLYAPNLVLGAAYFDDVSVKEIVTPSIGNGGFDDWTSSTDAAVWTETLRGTSKIYREDTVTHSGNYAVRCEIDGNGYQVRLGTPTVAGKKYSIYFWARTKVLGSQKYVNMVDDLAYTTVYTTSSVTATYAKYNHLFTAASSSSAILVGDTSVTFYIDDITLTSIGPSVGAGIAAGLSSDANYAASFNGGNWLSRGYSAVHNVGNFDWEIGCWFSQSRILNSLQGIISRTNGDMSNINSEYLISTSGTTTTFCVKKMDRSGEVSVSIPNLQVNSWYYVRGYHNATDDKIYIQLNNGTPVAADISGGTYSWNSNHFSVGISASSYFTGRICRVYKINRNLTSDEATYMYQTGRLPATVTSDTLLKGYWPCDEVSDNRADLSPSNLYLGSNSGVSRAYGPYYFGDAVSRLTDLIANATAKQITLAKRPTYDSVKLRGSVRFDGVDDCLIIPGDKIGTGNITIFAVISPQTLGANNAGRIIDTGAFVLTLKSTNKIYISSDNTYHSAASADNSITLGNSYVIAITRTLAGVTNIYINGVLNGAADQNSGTPAVGGDTWIGDRPSANTQFKGWIKGICIVNSLIPSTDIKLISKDLSTQAGGIY